MNNGDSSATYACLTADFDIYSWLLTINYNNFTQWLMPLWAFCIDTYWRHSRPPPPHLQPWRPTFSCTCLEGWPQTLQLWIPSNEGLRLRLLAWHHRRLRALKAAGASTHVEVSLRRGGHWRNLSWDSKGEVPRSWSTHEELLSLRMELMASLGQKRSSSEGAHLSRGTTHTFLLINRTLWKILYLPSLRTQASNLGPWTQM